MKQIISNRYLKEFNFSSFKELSTFVNNQNVEKKLSVENTFDDNYYCYVCFHALTHEKEFFISFSDDGNGKDLNFIFWRDSIVFNTRKNVYIIDDSLNIKKSIAITTPLIGLYLINDERLLVLEEAAATITDSNGKILKSELFDLVTDYSIERNLLILQTDAAFKTIELC